ncbi:DUF1837 domain-containing protein [Lysinibacillus sphaericus]|uniref:Hachiman antiphage defense system protein HamA n=1 Tax=Lysinibacillus sphaericus TaxID=1421 RepID=UPI0018CCF213|nr:Hachiman antiphage defense system protein HamA [Lysinibacillus sphaericus]QTB12952.1 DUF1837 domain-containing protein [Lysinibacillus sphaericus]
MQLLNHFELEETEFYIYKLKETELEVLLKKLPKQFRNCYVKDEDLEEIVKITGREIGDILFDNYIPENRSVMSGEFGEIFSYFFLKERYLPTEVEGPRKWLWKDDKNEAVHKTDVMLFNQEDVVSENDLVVSAEIKAKATKSAKNQIENAVNDMKKDYVSRLAVSLKWLQSKYLKDKDAENYKKMERFLKPVEHGTYKKDFKAVIVIDSELLEDEIQKYTQVADLNFAHEIIIITFKGLKECYENVYGEIIYKGENVDDSSNTKEMDSTVSFMENVQ